MAQSLNHRQWKTLTRAVAELREVPDGGDPLMTLLHVVQRALPCSLGRFSAIDPATFDCFGVNTHVISSGGEDLDDVAPNILPDCPLLQVNLNPAAPAVISTGAHVGSQRFLNSASWEIYYRPAGSRCALSARLSPPGFSPLITIDLDRDVGDFSTAEALLLELLRPHLREAYERVCATERARRAGLECRRGVAEFWLGPDLRPLNGAPALVPPDPPHRTDRLLPRSMAEVAWLHYGSFCRDSLGERDWSLQRTARGDHGDEVLTMSWDTHSRRTRITRGRPSPIPIGGPTPASFLALQSLGLTRREAEVLSWVSEGKSNELIARLLTMSPRTVQKHLEAVHRKLGVESRTAAAGIALRCLLGE